jgi:hypothetical protein
MSVADEVQDMFTEAARPNWVKPELFALARVDAFRHDFQEDRVIVSGYRLQYGIQRRSRWDRQDDREADAWIARQRRIATLAKRAVVKWRKRRLGRVQDALARSTPYRGRPVHVASIKARKLSAETVRAIRRDYAAGLTGFKRLGRRYGVSGAMISNIVHFDQYRDVRQETA